jgi:uncharacterized membrane protein YsdA (DUF1294 family)
LIILMHLLVLPVIAVTQSGPQVDWRWLLAIPLIFSLIAFSAYRSDKRRAEADEWRISESTLHFLELCGGWPGAFLAQRILRHKNAKISYQIIFWLIVLGYQCAALDSLLDWRFTRDAWFYLHSNVGS